MPVVSKCCELSALTVVSYRSYIAHTLQVCLGLQALIASVQSRHVPAETQLLASTATKFLPVLCGLLDRADPAAALPDDKV